MKLRKMNLKKKTKIKITSINVYLKKNKSKFLKRVVFNFFFFNKNYQIFTSYFYLKNQQISKEIKINKETSSSTY
jgi:predicted N-acyltransferase